MRLSRTMGVLLAALVLVGGANAAVYAATGGTFILGHKNYAGRTTLLTNTGRGHALVLRSKGAPLAVNNSKLVKNFNADMVDGQHASDLGTQSYVFYPPGLGYSSWTTMHVPMTGLPDGTYLVTYTATVTLSGADTLECSLSGGVTSAYGGGAVGTPAPTFTLPSYATVASGSATCSASGVVATSGTVTFFLKSQNGTMWDMNPAQVLVTFTRINTSAAQASGTPVS